MFQDVLYMIKSQCSMWNIVQFYKKHDATELLFHYVPKMYEKVSQCRQDFAHHSTYASYNFLLYMTFSKLSFSLGVANLLPCFEKISFLTSSIFSHCSLLFSLNLYFFLPNLHTWLWRHKTKMAAILNSSVINVPFGPWSLVIFWWSKNGF